jgi:hypothetical protein
LFCRFFSLFIETAVWKGSQAHEPKVDLCRKSEISAATIPAGNAVSVSLNLSAELAFHSKGKKKV